MKRFGMLVLSVSVLSLAGGFADDKKEEKLDATKVVGTWTITSGTKFGEAIDKESTKGTIVIDKEKIQIKAGDSVEHEMTYKLDTTKTPAHIDMQGTVGPAKGSSTEGIIEVKGDVLKLCYSFPGEKRPTAFESKKDSKDLYFELKPAKK